MEKVVKKRNAVLEKLEELADLGKRTKVLQRDLRDLLEDEDDEEEDEDE